MEGVAFAAMILAGLSGDVLADIGDAIGQRATAGCGAMITLMAFNESDRAASREPRADSRAPRRIPRPSEPHRRATPCFRLAGA